MRLGTILEFPSICALFAYNPRALPVSLSPPKSHLSNCLTQANKSHKTYIPTQSNLTDSTPVHGIKSAVKPSALDLAVTEMPAQYDFFTNYEQAWDARTSGETIPRGDLPPTALEEEDDDISLFEGLPSPLLDMTMNNSSLRSETWSSSSSTMVDYTPSVDSFPSNRAHVDVELYSTVTREDVDIYDTQYWGSLGLKTVDSNTITREVLAKKENEKHGKMRRMGRKAWKAMKALLKRLNEEKKPVAWEDEWVIEF